eukprot:jgi/Phyca11/22065/fgenesh1_pg.PHYCAscaffold_573_\
MEVVVGRSIEVATKLIAKHDVNNDGENKGHDLDKNYSIRILPMETRALAIAVREVTGGIDMETATGATTAVVPVVNPVPKKEVMEFVQTEDGCVNHQDANDDVNDGSDVVNMNIGRDEDDETMKTHKKRKEKKKAAAKVKLEPPVQSKKASKRVAPESSSEDEAKEQPTKRHKASTTKTAATKMVASEETIYVATRWVETLCANLGKANTQTTVKYMVVATADLKLEKAQPLSSLMVKNELSSDGE